MSTVFTLVLPWPPSANTYWRHPTSGSLTGRHLLSANGRAYRAEVVETVLTQLGNPPRLASRVAVAIRCHAPDERRRDLDNLLKGALDALTHAGMWLDDAQIDHLVIERAPILEGGALVIGIEAIADDKAMAA